MAISPFVGTVQEGEVGNISLEVIIENYLNYYALNNGHTARAKQLDLGHFLEYLKKIRRYKSEQEVKVSDWNASNVQRFVEDSLQKGEAPATVCRRLATIKHMGRTMAETVPGFVNPAREVRPPKVAVLRPKALDVDEVAEVKEIAHERVAKRDSFSNRRNEVIVALLLDTGLRADEVRLLRYSQIDDDLNWIHNVRTKGRQYRDVYITSEMRPLLVQYLQHREEKLQKIYDRKLSPKESKALPLFISPYGAVVGDGESFLMDPKSIWRAVRAMSCGTKLHPHLLRHSFAMDLLDESGDIRLVAQALGHSDVRVTMRYTERRAEDVAEALESSRKKAKELLKDES